MLDIRFLKIIKFLVKPMLAVPSKELISYT